MLQPDSPLSARVQAFFAMTGAIIAKSALPSGLYVVGMSALGSGIDISGLADEASGNLALNVATFVAGFFLSRTMLSSTGMLAAAGGARFGAYFGLSILSGLGIILGFVLLILPGVFLLIRWLPAFGFLLGSEESVSRSLRLSWERTRGHFWAILVGAALPILLLAAGGTIYFVALTSELFSSNALFVVANIALYAFTVVGSAYGFAIYALLKDDANELSGVFV